MTGVQQYQLLSYVSAILVFSLLIAEISCTTSDVDRAHGQPARQSATTSSYYYSDEQPASYAVDGNPSSCAVSDTANSIIAWWQVDLGDEYTVSNVFVLGSSFSIYDGYIPSFFVDVSNTNKADSFLPSELCFSFNQTVDPSLEQVNRTCSQGLVGRYVTLIRSNFSYSPSYFKLCEVNVFGTTFTVSTSTPTVLIVPMTTPTVTVLRVPTSTPTVLKSIITTSTPTVLTVPTPTPIMLIVPTSTPTVLIVPTSTPTVPIVPTSTPTVTVSPSSASGSLVWNPVNSTTTVSCPSVLNSTAIIVGVVIGFFLLIAVIIIIVILCRIRNGNRKEQVETSTYITPNLAYRLEESAPYTDLQIKSLDPRNRFTDALNENRYARIEEDLTTYTALDSAYYLEASEPYTDLKT